MKKINLYAEPKVPTFVNIWASVCFDIAVAQGTPVWAVNFGMRFELVMEMKI
jgi:hypothetical protein